MVFKFSTSGIFKVSVINMVQDHATVDNWIPAISGVCYPSEFHFSVETMRCPSIVGQHIFRSNLFQQFGKIFISSDIVESSIYL